MRWAGWASAKRMEPDGQTRRADIQNCLQHKYILVAPTHKVQREVKPSNVNEIIAISQPGIYKKYPSIHISKYPSDCNASRNVWKCWSSSKFLSWKIMSHSANPPLWLGAKGLMASERLHRRSATDINPTQGGETRENISCVSGGQGEKCSSQSAMVPLRWAIDPLPPLLTGCCVFGGTLPLLRDGRVKGQPSPNKWLKCVAARQGRYKYKILFVSHRSPRPMGDGHTHSEQVKCKEKRLLKERGQEWGKWLNGTKKNKQMQHVKDHSSSTQRKTGAKGGENNGLTLSFIYDFVLRETYL